MHHCMCSSAASVDTTSSVIAMLVSLCSCMMSTAVSTEGLQNMHEVHKPHLCVAIGSANALGL